MAKKKVSKRGRPPGQEKKALNIYLPIGKITRLKEIAKTEQRNVSVIIERAIDPIIV